MNASVRPVVYLRSLFSALVSGVIAAPILAQAPLPSTLPSCQAPRASEYLLLIATPTPDSQNRARQALPSNASITVCSYLGDTVTRVGGFTTLERVTSWAQYMNTSVGLQSFVARPPSNASNPRPTPTTPPPVVTAPRPTPITPPVTNPPVATAPRPTQPVNPGNSSFNPQPLGTGYAVLVDYFNRPETAVEVHRLLQQDVGLVAYGQRPYLLALYTSDSAVANTVLQQLTNQGMWAMVVDSRRVVLLRQAIDISSLTGSRGGS
jgi:hypothetical protein